jgi:hypothetical protein
MKTKPIPVSGASVPSNWTIASREPAEPPMPTIGKEAVGLTGVSEPMSGAGCWPPAALDFGLGLDRLRFESVAITDYHWFISVNITDWR